MREADGSGRRDGRRRTWRRTSRCTPGSSVVTQAARVPVSAFRLQPSAFSPGLYVHIPFCRQKCAYCDFASYVGMEGLYDDYVGAVGQEATRAGEAWSGVAFGTVYVGGGTPTALSPAALGQILAACRAALDLSRVREVTVEANPGTVDAGSLAALRRAGVNRLSLGVQSFDDAELRLLGRIHSADDARRAVAWSRDAGYANLSLDLMFGLPGQSLERWRRSLDEAIALDPEHLSLYALTVEECTPLAHTIEAGVLPPVDDDLAADMYEWAEDALDAAGYRQYEISNWAWLSPRDGDAEALPALACHHNAVYWRNEPYLGLGSAAQSYDGRRRYANVESPVEYVRRVAEGVSPVAHEEALGREATMGETVMLGLRLVAGVDAAAFRRRFGVTLREAYPREIDEFVEAGLLVEDAAGIRLTRRGRLLGNRVFAAFLRDG